MARLCGTDGVRGSANVELTCEMAYRLGQAAAIYLGKTIVVGRDTRRSGDMLGAALYAGIMSAGGTVLEAGIIPTPGVALLVRAMRAAGGAGAAAIAIVKLLLSSGFKNVTMCDRKGAIYAGRDGLNWIKEEMAQVTNLDKKAGSLADMLVGADVFIGVSAPGMVTKEMVQTMNKDAIIFACANPTPEIFPDEAKAGGARVVSTGRSDYPNQINNVLAFPGIFRGAFDVRASDINEEMKIAASNALANLISDEELNENYIIPAAFDPRVGPAVAKAVAEAARKSGVARL